MPVTLHINAPVLGQQIPHQHQALVNHGDERIRAFAPGVSEAISSRMLRFLVKISSPISMSIGEVVAHIKGGSMYINLIPPCFSTSSRSGSRSFSDERISLLSPQMSLFVQPLSWRRARPGQRHSSATRVCWLLGARLVHLLDHLKGQDNAADLAGLAVPDQFDLALVLEEAKRNLSGNGLSASRKRMISCCSCSVSRGMEILFFSVFYLVSDRVS